MHLFIPFSNQLQFVCLICNFIPMIGSIKDHPSCILYRKNSLELIELSPAQMKLVKVSSYGNTGSIRDGPYWTSRKNSLELIELSSINKVSLV